MLTLAGIKNDFWNSDATDRSQWIKVLCTFLEDELLSDDPKAMQLQCNDNVVQAITTCLSMEFGKNFKCAWAIFADICDKFVLHSSIAMSRLYVIVIVLSCNAFVTDRTMINSKVFSNVFNGFLEKMQEANQGPAFNLYLLSIAKDLLTTMKMFVCPRQSRSDLHTIVLDEGIMFSFIDVIFQLECSDGFRDDLNFRLTCLKTIQHLSPSIKDERIRLNIVKHLFERLHFVKWSETIRELLVPPHDQSKCERLEVSFNIERGILCNTETSQVICHAQGGRGYCQARRGLSGESGTYQWKFKVLKDSKGNEGICLGVSMANVRDFSHLTSKDMWLYRSYNGGLYHDGEVVNPINILPEFSMDDVITVQLDLDEGTLSFAKNTAPLILAFDNMPNNIELYPVVVFYTSNHGEKVQIFDLCKVPKDLPLLCGEPICAPPNETLAQSYIDLLRWLYDHWKTTVEKFLLQHQTMLKTSIDEIGNLQNSSKVKKNENSIFIQSIFL